MFGNDVGGESAKGGPPGEKSGRLSPYAMHSFPRPHLDKLVLGELRAVYEMQATAVGIWLHELGLSGLRFVQRLDPRVWVDRKSATRVEDEGGG